MSDDARDGSGLDRTGRLLTSEMAPNRPDSTDHRPQSDRLSEAILDQLRPRVGAWSMLTAYLSLVRHLRVGDPASRIPTPSSGQTGRDDAHYGEAVRLLREMHPHLIAGYADMARQVLTGIRPRWRGVVIDLMFAEPAGWLRQSGQQPDPRMWFAGAKSYLRAMVPARHVEQALQLLNYDQVVTEHTIVRALPHAGGVAAFSLAQPESTVWYATAMRAHPVAAIHAAAALAAWVWAEPQAVIDPDQVALDLVARAMRFSDLAPPPDSADSGHAYPSDDREDEFVPPWQQQPPMGLE